MANLATSKEHNSQVAVLMVPFPAQGHLNQLLQFSCIVSSYDLPVYFVASTIHNHQVKSRANGVNSEEISKIHFHDIPFPSFESDTTSRTNIIPWLYGVVCAMSSLRKPFASYLQNMCQKYKKVIIVHDNLMSEVVSDVASYKNAESYLFRCVPAFFQCGILFDILGKPFPEDFPNLPSLDGCFPDGFTDLFPRFTRYSAIREGDIHNTSRLIEAPYLEILEKQIYGNKESFAIGPMVSKLFSFSSKIESREPEIRHECLKWLDNQEPNSVIYISFGTTTSLSNEQIKELAFGLEQSKIKFLWVLRDSDQADKFDHQTKRQLPEFFEQQIKEKGFVYRNWAPQPEILNHGSVGGFMSHCGWNSCIESITMGVPIAAWPIHSDQPINSSFIADVLKMGLIVRDWSKRDEIVKADAIEKGVRRLMATDEGIKLRGRAQELGLIVQNATRPGGASQLEMDSFISHITR